MQFVATTTTGSGRGEGLGFPTMNLSIDEVPEGIPEGIHAAFVEYGGDQHMAAIHYGARPVFDDSPSFEVHVIDEVVDTPPPSLTVELVRHLRDVQNFSSAEELVSQLHMDIDQARDILTAHAQED